MSRIKPGSFIGVWVVFGILSSGGGAQAQKQGAKPSIADLMARRVNLRADNLDIRLALQQLFEQVGANYVIDRSVKGTVTVSLKKVPFRTALVSALKSSDFTYEIDNGVFRIVTIRDNFGLGTGPQYPPPGSPYVIPLSFITATVAARSLRSMPGFGPEDGVTIQPLPALNRLIVISQTTDQLREIREVLRMMDCQPQQVEIRAELALTAVGAGNRRPFAVFASTGRTFSSQLLTLATTITGRGDPHDGIALQDGVSRLKLTPRINGDNIVRSFRPLSLTLDADWEAALTWRVRGETRPCQMHKTFHGSLTVYRDDTKALASTVIRLDSAHEVELRLFLTPRILKTERDELAVIRDINTAIVLDFADRSGAGGEKLAALATNNVALELARSARFEVLKPEEIQHTVKDLRLQPPWSALEITRIADNLGANVVVTGEITSVRQVEGREPKAFTVGLEVRLQDPYEGDVLSRTAEVAEAQAKPGQTDENAVIESAVYKAGSQAVRRMIALQVPEATVLATRVAGGNAGFVEIDRGFRDGIRVGMEMGVYRGRQRVGKIKIVRVQPTSAEGAILESAFGIRPEDKARVILPAPAKTTTR